MRNYLKPLLLLLLLFPCVPVFAFTGADTAKVKTDTAKKDTVYHPLSRYSVYEPNYILSNFRQNYYGQVKFKVSFKYDLDFGSRKNQVFFAYTQTAFWDLYQHSAPMRELDFTPTLFYQRNFFDTLFKMRDWHFRVMSVLGGYLHQSDGQPDGPLNRSIFKITITSNMEFAKNHPSQDAFGLDAVDIYLRTWIWNMVDADNYNIADYQGYGQFITTFKFDYSNKSQTNGNQSYPLVINDSFVPARAGLSNELNVWFNPFIGCIHARWVPYFVVQYFHGYGENLINYDNRYTGGKALNEYRVGIQFRVF